MTKAELLNKATNLTMELHDLKYPSQTHSHLLGMADALLTIEQLETMVSYLEQWLKEKKSDENKVMLNWLVRSKGL